MGSEVWMYPEFCGKIDIFSVQVHGYCTWRMEQVGNGDDCYYSEVGIQYECKSLIAMYPICGAE